MKPMVMVEKMKCRRLDSKNGWYRSRRCVVGMTYPMSQRYCYVSGYPWVIQQTPTTIQTLPTMRQQIQSTIHISSLIHYK